MDKLQSESSIKSKGYGIIYKKVMLDRNLTIEAKAIYSYFCSYAGAGDTAFPSISKIVYDLDISESRYRRHFNLLKKYDYIRVQQVKENNKFSHNLYTLVEFPSYHFERTRNECTQIECAGNDYTNNNSSKINNSNINNPNRDGFLLDYFRQKYKLATGKNYTKQKKDVLTLNELQESKQEEEIKDIIDFYFSSNDQFLKTSGYSISKIISCVLPKYDIKDKQQQQKQNNAVPQMNNYDQREYDEEHLRSFYCNID